MIGLGYLNGTVKPNKEWGVMIGVNRQLVAVLRVYSANTAIPALFTMAKVEELTNLT